MFQSEVSRLYQNKRTTGLNTRRLLTGMYENIPIPIDARRAIKEDRKEIQACAASSRIKPLVRRLVGCLRVRGLAFYWSGLRDFKYCKPLRSIGTTGDAMCCTCSPKWPKEEQSLVYALVVSRLRPQPTLMRSVVNQSTEYRAHLPR
eukprot:IDg14372t1